MALTIKLLISEDQLKQQSVINENVDWKQLRPLVLDIQNRYIHPLLGTALYDELRTEIAAASITANNTTLLEQYLWPCLIAYCMADSPDYLLFKFMNKAIVTKNSENSNPVTIGDAIKISANWRNKAEWYAQRVTNYLCANATTYPLFENPGTTSDTIQPNINNYTSGMVLDDEDIDFAARFGLRSFSDRKYYQ